MTELRCGEPKKRRLNTSAAAFSSLKNDEHEVRLATPWNRSVLSILEPDTAGIMSGSEISKGNSS